MKYRILLLLFGIISCGTPSEEKQASHTFETDSELTVKSFPKLDSTRYNVAF
jgi:hypothetical protein